MGSNAINHSNIFRVLFMNKVKNDKMNAHLSVSNI